MSQHKVVAYEENVVAGSPRTHYPRMDLGENPVKSGWLVADVGDLKVKLDDDSSEFTIKQGEVLDLTGSEIYKITIDAVSGTASYRLVCTVFDIQ